MRYSLLFYLIFSVCQAIAQQEAPVFKRITHPFMPPITSEYFFFSEDGLVWFSTSQGLTSFDGSDLVYHSTSQQVISLGLNRISSMAEDKNHNFYLGTQLGLYYYDRKARTFANIAYTFSDSRKQLPLLFGVLYMDGQDLLYAGTISHGFFVYDTRTKKLNHHNLDYTKPDSWEDRRFNTVSSFAGHYSDVNKMWVGSFHGIYLFDKHQKSLSQNFEIISSITHRYNPTFNTDKKFIDVGKMDVTNDSIIWFNSWAGGFAKYNTQSGKVIIPFGRDALLKTKDIYYGYIIPGFTSISSNKYLLGVYNGKTVIYDALKNKASYFNITQNDFSEEETRCVGKDKKGNIWLLQKGLLYASIPFNRSLQTIKVPDLTRTGIIKPKLRAVYFDTTTSLFYCCFLGSTGVHVYDTNFILQKITPTSIINNYYNYGSTVDDAISKDGSGRFWTGGWKVHVLLPGKNKFGLVDKEFPSLKWLGAEDQFHSITATRSRDILFRKNNGVIYRIDHNTLEADTFRCPEIKADSLEIKSSSCWYDPERDFIYLARKEGMAQFDPGNKKTTVISNASLLGNLSGYQGECAVTLDSKGRLWFMIPRYGIRIIDPETLLCVDSIQYGERGLTSNSYTDIIGGSENYILFRSRNGVIVYNYKEKQSFLFDNSNGLSSPDTKSFLYSNGYVFMGKGSGRIEYFRLSGLDNYVSTVAPYLNSVIADSIDVINSANGRTDSVISLKYYQNTLAFSFSAPEFFFPERIEYAYQLVPLDVEWHYTNYFNRKIIYTRLSPGKYTFRLKAQMEGGDWNKDPMEYVIVITPAWWQTSWFKLLCVLAAIALFILFIQRRIQLIRKKEQQRSKHEKELLELEAKALRAQMNPHFIFNSLNSIKSLINKNENDKAAEYLTTFSKLIRTLFQNSDKREISLFEELETCKLYTQLEKMRFGEKVEFVFDIDESPDLKGIKIPALILQPFIENAIWHGLIPKEGGGKVLVSVRSKDETIECIIDDDGIGRELSKQYKAQYRATHESKGIGLTQSRLELDKILNEREDTIRIVDKKDEKGFSNGTSIIITFKENK